MVDEDADFIIWITVYCNVYILYTVSGKKTNQ